MTTIEHLAEAALSGEALRLRGLAQDMLLEFPQLADVPRPTTEDQRLLAIAAALVELIAERTGQPAPAWTADIGPAPAPIYLVRSALTMRHLRRLCETGSPEPLRRRLLYAPPNYLAVA